MHIDNFCEPFLRHPAIFPCQADVFTQAEQNTLVTFSPRRRHASYWRIRLLTSTPHTGVVVGLAFYARAFAIFSTRLRPVD